MSLLREFEWLIVRPSLPSGPQFLSPRSFLLGAIVLEMPSVTLNDPWVLRVRLGLGLLSLSLTRVEIWNGCEEFCMYGPSPL